MAKSEFTKGWQKQIDARQKDLDLPPPDPPAPPAHRCDYPGCNAYATRGYGPPGFHQPVMFRTCWEHKLPA